jgi:acetyl-CoA carboxylase biotin carboxyl carrier protein
MKLQEIQDLIKLVSRSAVTDVEIEKGDFKIKIRSEAKKKKGADAEPTLIHSTMPMGIPQMPMTQVASVPAQSTNTQSEAEQHGKGTAETKSDEDDSKYITIKSPMIGTFYRASAPDKDAYVNVGDTVRPGKVICIVEAMKLFNEIESEVSGTIVKVLLDDASPVEYDQPLFLVDPS